MTHSLKNVNLTNPIRNYTPQSLGHHKEGNHLPGCSVSLMRFARGRDPMTKIAIPLLAIFALSACETVKGAGRDMQAAGTAVTSEAAETQSEM